MASMKTREQYEALLANPNVQKGLSVIRATEGTALYSDPYSTAFGGNQFDNSGNHPNKLYNFSTKSGKKMKTSAAGAYQFLGRTWNAVAGKLGLKDMTKQNQDIAALALIDGRGGLDALVEGDLKTFVEKAGPEWASLPTAPKEYDQPTKGWEFVEQAWESAAPAPVDRVELASLPTPSERPSLEGQLGYKPGGILAPDTAGSFSPVSTAAAAEMPKGILDARPYRHTGIPDTSSLLDARPDTLQVKGDPQSYVQPMSGQPSFQERPITEPTYMAGTNNGAPIPSTPSHINLLNNRPILDNGDGSFSTEESITVTDPRLNGGAATNIPSIWEGKRTSSEDEAVTNALNSGQKFDAYEDIPSAVEAAKQRSGMLAKGLPNTKAPPTSLLDQKGAMPAIQTAPTGLLDTKGALPAAQPAALEPASPINTNPESFATDEEFLMNQPVVAAPQILQSPAPVAPTAPVLAPQPVAAPQDPYSLQQQQAYTPPPQNSAMDVWQGKAQSGVDNTGQYDLNRSANGDIYRYSKAYDRTDVLDADGNYKGQHKGKIDGPVGNGGVSLPSFGGFNIKPETKMGERVRGFGGGMAGSMAGGILGPIGGILGGLIGRELAQGKNPMGLLNRNQNQGQQVGTFTQNGQLYPEAPTVQHFSDNSGRSRSEADAAKGSTGKSYSKSILDAAYGGSGGLF